MTRTPTYRIAIIGTGYVADLYMASLKSYAGISVVGAYDIQADRLTAFGAHWGVPVCGDLDALLARTGPDDLVLNLTNPRSHFDVTQTVLTAGRHVYSEKPLALDMAQAHRLHKLASDAGLILASAPCSVLGEAAQTLWAALRHDVIGTPLLAYAELDDGFVSQAPYDQWVSVSGAPWPAEDEFAVGCTLEHAGYYLSWLMVMFGPVVRVVAEAAELDPGKPVKGTPDYTTAVLTFDTGCVARLTCSVIAGHDHGLRIFGTTGTLELNAAWSNTAPVRRRARRRVRRRLLDWPIAKRIRLKRPTHPVARTGMNFMLGPAEVLSAIHEGRSSRLSADFALHLTEVTLALQSAGFGAGAVGVESRFSPVSPMPWAEVLA